MNILQFYNNLSNLSLSKILDPGIQSILTIPCLIYHWLKYLSQESNPFSPYYVQSSTVWNTKAKNLIHSHHTMSNLSLAKLPEQGFQTFISCVCNIITMNLIQFYSVQTLSGQNTTARNPIHSQHILSNLSVAKTLQPGIQSYMLGCVISNFYLAGVQLHLIIFSIIQIYPV